MTNSFRYFDDFEKKIPRAEIAQIEKILKNAIKELNSAYLITICGSYRRGKEESGDIDVLVTHPDYTSKVKDEKKKAISLKAIVECLEKKQLIIDTISLGSTKFMVLKQAKPKSAYTKKTFLIVYCFCRECVGYQRTKANLSDGWIYVLHFTINIIAPYFTSQEVIYSTRI